MQLYGYLKVWRKNPHCSFSCCLAVLLPLNDLQGEISGLAGKNVLNTQLQSGDYEMTTLHASVKNSGAIDVTLEDHEESDDEIVEKVEDTNSLGAECSKNNRHQATQTKLSALTTVTAVAQHKSVKEEIFVNH